MITVNAKYFTSESWVIDQADGEDEVEILVDGKPRTFCGVCGRLVHHPDCPRFGGEDDDAEAG